MSAPKTLRRLYLINPCNSLVTIVSTEGSRWNRYRVWKPLGLMVLAGMTPAEWEVIILDENLQVPDYATMPRPDLVGITAFTSQANRAYEVAAQFRSRGVPVVMGGIHATVCAEEATSRVDAVVTGEAEGVWARVLRDFQDGCLKRRYDGGQADMRAVPIARHDMLSAGYAFGSIQTTRGCPLNCSFCSVTAINGVHYRQRPIADVVREFRCIPEKRVLIVDDNLIGTRQEHIVRARDLFRALADAKLGKEWIGQVTINFGDDDELMELAVQSGCKGVFIGFESTTPEGLGEVGKRFNLLHGRDIRASVRRIQRHGIMVVGSFILGLDVDRPGVGMRIAEMAIRYGVDHLNALFLTPLPGTRLWEQMRKAGRLDREEFPADWKYYTLTLPVAQYCNFSRDEISEEMLKCNQRFFSTSRILHRLGRHLLHRRSPIMALVASLSCRSAIPLERKAYRSYIRSRKVAPQAKSSAA
ncbi:MAG: B12-binding domain-containing radical SAM protein [Deltaproteobacteria bacterium]|nr:B12-binding domain-containing radical SAM protein [Deltaproteobacteria bacterium]